MGTGHEESDRATRWRPGESILLPVGVARALATGGSGLDPSASIALRTASGRSRSIVVGVPLTRAVARRIRRGQPGADVIALLAIAGALALREMLAGAVIALMLSGGDYLDERAFGRARRELGALAARAPTVGARREAGRRARGRARRSAVAPG